MSVLSLLKQKLDENKLVDELILSEELGNDELEAEPTEEIPEEEPAEEDGGNVDGDPIALVKALLKYAPGKSEEVGTMLKYAANSNPEYDIFDASLDYFQSLEDKASAVEDEVLGDEEPTEEIPSEEPTEEPAGDEEDFDIEL